MTPFQAALSQKLAVAYVAYFNSLGLTQKTLPTVS